MEPAGRNIAPFLVLSGFATVGVLVALLILAGEGFEGGLVAAVLLGLSGGILLCAGAIRFTRHRPSSGGGLGLSGVLLMAGMAATARNSPVFVQVAFVTFFTGFFVVAAGVLLLEYRRAGSGTDGEGRDLN